MGLPVDVIVRFHLMRLSGAQVSEEEDKTAMACSAVAEPTMHVGSPRSDLVQVFVARVGSAGIAAFQVLAGKQDGHDQERGVER